MKVKQRLTVADTPDRVWNFLSDVRQVATCVPGLELKEERDDGALVCGFLVKVGPLTAKLDGEGFLSQDHESHSATLSGKGVDKRGGSRASGKLRYAVTSDPEGTAVEIEADFNLSGPLAQIGRSGIVEDVARSLADEFAANIADRLAATPDGWLSKTDHPEVQTGDTADATKSATGAPDSHTEMKLEVRGFDAGSALSQALWRRVLRFLRRLIGLGGQREDLGPFN